MQGVNQKLIRLNSSFQNIDKNKYNKEEVYKQ